ncbi:unnamed protein product [Amoebophrya sp. A25]|nr:unnamed protein product [Amoebophrya sp. A25]|eukprot:GSA25T00013417001.1
MRRGLFGRVAMCAVFFCLVGRWVGWCGTCHTPRAPALDPVRTFYCFPRAVFHPRAKSPSSGPLSPCFLVLHRLAKPAPCGRSGTNCMEQRHGSQRRALLLRFREVSRSCA